MLWSRFLLAALGALLVIGTGGLPDAVASASGENSSESHPIIADERPQTSAGSDFTETENLRRLQMKLAEKLSSAGLGVDSNGVVIVRVYLGEDLDAVATSFASNGFEVKVLPSQYTRQALGVAVERLHSTHLREGEAFGFYYDAVDDVIAITGSVSKSTLQQVIGENQEFEFEQSSSAGRASRLSSSPPHYGGAKMMNSTLSCTSGFTVYASGAYRMVTAGHCGGIGTAFYSPGGQYLGEVRHKASFPYYDLAMVSWSSYSARIYTGPTTASFGVDSNVRGPGINGGYCSSGSVSLELCNLTVNSTTASFCDSAGCTYPVITYTGGAPQPGDSGAPFYGKTVSTNKAHIRGVVFAYSGSTGYAESWNRVESTFLATIATW